MPKIYFIAGCNGAGKSTISLTLLPEMLNCKEFVNADNIAAGLSPFKPNNVLIESGRIMLKRIDQLAKSKVDFAIETTLSGKNYPLKIKDWQQQGYEVVLIYFWLNSPKLAVERVKDRVKKGGHSVPSNVIKRRYSKGIRNLFDNYMPICDYWLVIDNSKEEPELVSEGKKGLEIEVFNKQIWEEIKSIYNETK